MSHCWKKRATLNYGKDLEIGHWKGKYFPAKRSSIRKHLLVTVFLSNWMNLHAFKAYSQIWGSFSRHLQYCKMGDFSKYTSLLLSVVGLFPFLTERLWMQDEGSDFQLSSVLFLLSLFLSRCNFDRNIYLTFFKWASVFIYKVKETKVRKIFEKETGGTGLKFNFWKNKTSQTPETSTAILRLKFAL